jgi:hypothetical protein
MKELLISLLETFGYPVKLQGSLGEKEQYPDSFFTFWNNDSEDGDHYDNDAVYYVWSFDVNFYSTDPELVNSKLLEAKTLLKENGFIIGGKGDDVPSDEATHTGRGMTVKKIDI